MDVIIYTDGSARNNPGKGGYGIVMISGSHRKEYSKGFKHTTNNRIHKLMDGDPDTMMMNHIGNRYKTEGWYPPVSSDLKNYFKTQSRTLEQFIDQDRNIFERRFINDRDL